MFRLFCLLIGYVFGLIPTAYIVGKAQGIDIREHGSGNAGTTNTLRVLGKRSGGIVLAGDLLKCFLGILVACLIFKKMYPDYYYLIKIYTAFGIILGHDYPFFLHFKGGKGIACFGGMVLSFFGPLIPACVVTFFGTFFLTHYVSLSSIMLLFTFLAEVIIFGQAGFFGMTQIALWELYAVVLALVILALFQHRKNIVRLFKGEERRTYLRKKSEERIDKDKIKTKADKTQSKDNFVKETEEINPKSNEDAMDSVNCVSDQTNDQFIHKDIGELTESSSNDVLNETTVELTDNVLNETTTESTDNVFNETNEQPNNKASNEETGNLVNSEVSLDERSNDADEHTKNYASNEISDEQSQVIKVEKSMESLDDNAADEDIVAITELMDEIAKPVKHKKHKKNNSK